MIIRLVHLFLICNACHAACFFDSDCPSGQVCKHEFDSHGSRPHCEIDTKPSTGMILIYVFVVFPIVFFTIAAICILTCKYINEGPDEFNAWLNTWCMRCRRSSAPTNVVSHPSQVPSPTYMPMQTQVSVDSLPPSYTEAVASAPSISIIGSGPQAGDRRQFDAEKL